MNEDFNESLKDIDINIKLYGESKNARSTTIAQFPNEYDDVIWLTNPKSDEIVIIHTFAINPNYMGNKIGMKIINKIKENALKNNKKSIRIDVIDGNEGAIKFFEHLGFEYVNTIEIYHNAVGLEKFHLYEFPLPD